MFGESTTEPPIGSPAFAEYWEKIHGRENMDAVTLRNLDEMNRKSGMTSAELEAAQMMLERVAAKFHYDGEDGTHTLTAHWLDGGQEKFWSLDDVVAWAKQAGSRIPAAGFWS